ncbi:DCL family protein [Andreprevotia sp. IGB-42]|uniref:DCL family protein n=1 Tax=Andreprevotia sp. IGB-42 TaxID=2497473 RepID=UPI00135CDBE0|nr:DCL family protein [Andreprevotia sp. IGB-42]
MPAKSISFGSLHFEKKEAAATYLKEMLHRYDVGDRVNTADTQVLTNALLHHPDANEKIGCGISYFSVRSADFGTKCFWINRLDGTTEKFSYSKCIYPKRTANTTT